VDFQLDDEQVEIRDAVRAFLSTHIPEVGAALPWSSAGRLGLPGLLVPEAAGGTGKGSVEAALVMEELGRLLVRSPFLDSSILATSALNACYPSEQAAADLVRLASGAGVATVVLPAGGSGAEGTAQLFADEGPDGYTVRGVEELVLCADVPEISLVFAETHEGLGMFRILDRGTIEIKPAPVVDVTRPLAQFHAHAAPAVRLHPVAGESVLLRRLLSAAVVMIGAEQVGGAQSCLDSALVHARTREQFGRPIGTFQVLRHRLADVLIAVEAARTAVLHAAWVLDTDPEPASALAAMVKIACSDAYVLAASESLQIHGGMGFTWEQDCHRYLKRAQSSRALFGVPDHFRDQLEAQIS
jgi:alkylation response protein AidB-like acyl-CoA dehydrogenase